MPTISTSRLLSDVCVHVSRLLFALTKCATAKSRGHDSTMDDVRVRFRSPMQNALSQELHKESYVSSSDCRICCSGGR